jgi:uncharacterized protein (DUF983 family)
MPQDNLISMLFQDPPGDVPASLAWRCVDCGRLRIYDAAVARPASCADCGGKTLQSVRTDSPPASDPGALGGPSR